jgi:hypothetical protein
MPNRVNACLLFAVLLAGLATVVWAGPVPSPTAHFGFAIGDDYQLATYTQTAAYFEQLAAASDRVKLVDIGRTEEGRPQYMLVISAPENQRALARFKDAAQRLARAETLTDVQARALAADGRAVVWIDGGLHATETVGSHQLIETAWQLASGNDPETLRILRDVIVLLAHANPDGQELIASWYMREPVPSKRSLANPPRLYHKYIGHDNNRDFFLSAMRESTNLNRQLYLEWFPQVVYNHHQSGPAGTVMFVPPFRDPFNHVFDPMVVTGIEALGTAIQSRFLVEDKPGATSRSGAGYSTWFNGSLRTTSYFHNMIGLLTEIIGSPTPMRVPLVARRQLPTNDLTAPVAPQEWRYRRSIDYSVSANRAVLDYASRHREELLFNIYKMGRNSIERGRRDHWTPRPSRIDEIVRLAAAEKRPPESEDNPDAEDGSPPAPGFARLPLKYWDLLRKPEWRDPRGFIVPADQPDFPTAVKFINALVKTGIAVHRATAGFKVGGRTYPAGSYVVKTDQAFRPHGLDMFEPQDHPNDFKYEGGPPNRPYDVTGWTLAYSMGVKFDRVLDAFDGPFERLPFGEIQKPPPGRIEAGGGAGWLLSHRVNDSFVLVTRLLKAGAEVFWLKDGLADEPLFGRGAVFVPAREPVRAVIEKGAAEFGLTVQAVAARPPGEALKLAAPRIALWDRYGGSIDSGWTRWLFEQFEVPFEVIYSPRIDAGNLRKSYDVIVLVDRAVPAVQGTDAAGKRKSSSGGGPSPNQVPAEYRDRLGRLTAEKSVPALKEFLQAGGTVIALGSSTNLAYHLKLPVTNALVEKAGDGRERPLPAEKFFIPGSILAARVDATAPLAWGMEDTADIYFERSPVFRLTKDAAAAGVRPIIWFDTAQPLRSGWAWGQKQLADGVVVAEAAVGSGRLYLMGCEVAFRAQTHGTFKLLFNALYLGTAQAEK